MNTCWFSSAHNLLVCIIQDIKWIQKIYNIAEVFSFCVDHKMFSLCLPMTRWRVCECGGVGAGPFIADCCTSCVPQTPPKPNHRKSSTLSCRAKDTAFSCRWATSSLLSCCWSSSSSSSSSSHVDTSPKVWTNFCTTILTWHKEICVDVGQTFVISVFYPQPSLRWEATHKHSHQLPLKHTLRCVFLSPRQVWAESLQLGAVRDGLCWSGRLQPGGQKHRWGPSLSWTRPVGGFKFTPPGVCFQTTRTTCWKKKLASAVHQRS